ncbi:MAG: nucleoside triphosphate pyrophosphohydrolase family protein [Saprospiraceae bacterium]
MEFNFDEPQGLNDVAAFHNLFSMPVLEVPTIPDEKRCALRINLLSEELKELEQAIADKNIVEVADALCDLQYVLSGAVLEFGLGHKFKSLFDEVQASNMSKACPDEETAVRTQNFYLTEKNTESHIVEKDGEYLVYRNSDNKVLKSIDYKEAQLERILYQ